MLDPLLRRRRKRGFGTAAKREEVESAVVTQTPLPFQKYSVHPLAAAAAVVVVVDDYANNEDPSATASASTPTCRNGPLQSLSSPSCTPSDSEPST